MPWIPMPIQQQWHNASGAPLSGGVLVAYTAGSTPGAGTVVSIAITKGGGSPQSSITLNADGQYEVSGNEVIPYIDREFQYAIYPTSAAAAAHTGAFWGPIDNVKIAPFESGLFNDPVADYVAIRALDTGTLTADSVLTVTNSGIGGDGVLRNVVGHGLTDNGGTIIVISADWYWEREELNYARVDNFENDIQSAIDNSLSVSHGGQTVSVTATIETRFGQKYFGESSPASILSCADSYADVMMNCSESNHIRDLQFLQISSAKLATGLRIIDPELVGGNTKTWRVERVDFVGLDIGAWVTGHANSMNDGNFFACNTGLKIGFGGQTGSAVLTNCKFRQNYTGLHIIEHTDPDLYPQTSYIFGGLFEFNIQHIKVEPKAAVQIYGGYYRDIPFICFGGGGDIEFFGGEVQAKCGNAADRSDIWPDFVWNSASGGTDISYTAAGRYLKFHGAIIFLENTYTGATLNRGTVFGECRELTLIECEFKVRAKAAAQPYLVDTDANPGTKMGVRSTKIKNYVGNGVFQNDAQMNTTYIVKNGGAGEPDPVADTTRRNPWGGYALKLYRAGAKFPFKIPKELVGKPMLLTLYTGRAVGTVTTFAGYDEINSTGLTFADTAEIDQYSGISSSTTYVGFVGQTLGSNETIGMATYVVECTSSAGLISIFSLSATTDANAYCELYGVTLTELDSGFDVTTTENINVGWVDSIPAIAHNGIPFTSGDTTPSVSGHRPGDIYKTAGSTAITAFDDGEIGDTITVVATAGITITNGSPIKLTGAANYVMTADDTLTLTQFAADVWTEVSRSVN